MKNMNVIKRLASISAALVMAATSTMALAAFAADGTTDNTLTISTKANQAEHSYSAYKIFSGTYESNQLAGIDWAEGVNSTALINAIKNIEVKDTSENAADDAMIKPFENATTAPAVAAALGKFGDDSDVAQKFAKAAFANKGTSTEKQSSTTGSVTTIANLEDGYYLIVDNGKTDTDKTNNAISRYMLTTVGGTGENANKTMEVKMDEASVTKKVYEGDVPQDLADANVSDNVKFRLAATLPSNLGDYDTYKLVFHDTLDLPGFEVDDSGNAVITEIKYILKSGDTETEITGLENDNEAGTPNTNVKFKFFKDDILTGLTTKVTEGEGTAVTPKAGDQIIVEYKAKLVPGAKTTPDTGNDNKVTLEYSNNPNSSGSGDNTTTETPEDIVSVFTYELDWNKIDKATKQAVAGAEFKLQATDGTNANKWYKITKGENGAKDVVEWVDNETDATVLTGAGDNNNQFVVPGLDKGTYFLKETKVPDGYNAPAGNGFKLEIDRTFNTDYLQNFNNENDPLTALTLKAGAGDAETLTEVTEGNESAATTGTVTTNIENASGTELPSTGGIGTKIFFAGGGTLVLGAGVTLIAKKRMKNKE